MRSVVLLAAICLTSAVFLVWCIARVMRRRGRWEDLAPCACPVLPLRKQDGSGCSLKTFHSNGCPFRLAPRGGYAEPRKVLEFLQDEPIQLSKKGGAS